MTLPGLIKDYNGERLIISVPFTDTRLLARRRIESCEVILSDGRSVTPRQRRYIYAMLRDIKEYSGHEVEYLKDYFKADCIARSGGKWFSLSSCSMTQANELIELIIQFCIVWGIPTQDDLAPFAPDIDRYIYMCLKNKVCCITRQKAELHHVDHVGMGRDRKEITHAGMRAMPLTRKLHTEAHAIGQKSFDEKYHVHGIPITLELCKVWGVKSK